MIDWTKTMPNENTESDLFSMFKANAEWEFATMAQLQDGNIWPNMLAYHESSATIALIVKRSPKGGDFALGKAGHDCIEAALESGHRLDGRPIRQAFIVYVDVDSQAKDSVYLLKVVGFETLQDAKRQLTDPPYEGKSGTYYWWTRPPASGKGGFVW
jgi:hypothetical protein